MQWLWPVSYTHLTDPKHLFNFTGSDEDMATIDVIIRKVGDEYCACLLYTSSCV